jgi:long-chain acyl-CoA synthetase
MVVLAEDLRKTQTDPATRAKVESELKALLDKVNATLSGYEQLEFLLVMSEPWSIEKGTLTPTMKLKRAGIEAGVKGKIDGWFSARKPVLWA